MRAQLRSRPLDAVVADLATVQDGVVARWQLRELGMKRSAIGRRVKVGRLHRVHRGVYAVGHKRLTRKGRWMAAVLAAGEGAALKRRSAAALHGIRASTAPAEVTTGVRADEVAEVDGIPTTTVARTLLDLAPVLTVAELERAIREADYLSIFDLKALEVLLDRYPRRAGRRKLEAALKDATYGIGITRKELEARFRRGILVANLLPPEFNAAIELGATTFEVDVLWREQDIIVELDSWQAHGTRSSFESDRERDRKLKLAGYEVIRVTWRQLDAAIADLEALLSGRATPACASRRTPALPRGSPR